MLASYLTLSNSHQQALYNLVAN